MRGTMDRGQEGAVHILCEPLEGEGVCVCVCVWVVQQMMMLAGEGGHANDDDC